MIGQPEYITIDDFKRYWGKDLRNMLRSDDNESNQAESFLYRIEQRMKRWIDANTFRNIRWERMTQFQLTAFKEALLEQAMYVLENGDIDADSGYDQEEGLKIRQSDLAPLAVCRPAINCLKNAGLYNLVMKNRPRHLSKGGVPYPFF